MALNNFRDFHLRFVKLFRFFAVVPMYFTDAAKNTLKLNPLYIGFSTCFLGVYWTGVVFTFLISDHLNNKISVISNWIQMLGNSLALTTTLVCTALKYKDLDMILSQFEKIDNALCSIDHKVDYANHIRKSKLIVLTYLACLGLILSYDFYVTIDMYQMTSIWYWLVSVTPICIYSMGLYQAMFMIFWIKCRCNLVNQSLKTIQANADSKFLISITPSPPTPLTILPADHEQGLGSNLIPSNKQRIIDMMKKNSKKAVDIDYGILSKLFTVMNDLCKLSKQIDEYYGLFFLSSIGALFAITSIQVYYCYVTAISFDEKQKYTVWTLFVCINMVLLNLSLIIGITSVCESVSIEATKILQNFSALQIQKEMPMMNELSIWVHPMVSYMKFTAYGFFTIDYNMLCGFMTALITYLVIFIQFYSISGEHGSNSVRSTNSKP